MTDKLYLILIVPVLWLCLAAFGARGFSSALADSSAAQLKFTSKAAVYSVSGESYVRDLNGHEECPNENEYVSFMVTVTNPMRADFRCTEVYFRVDNGEKLFLSDFTLKAGQSVLCHIWRHNMEKLAPGSHLVQLFMNGENVYNRRMYLMRNWRPKITFPTPQQIDSVKNDGRSPYIVFWPDFGGISGFTQYSIDFSVDHMNDGTYFCAVGGQLDHSEFDKLHGSGWSGSTFYCGLQSWENGKTGVIMSVWDLVPPNGSNAPIVCANQLYPSFKAGVSKDSMEGRFQQFIVEYPWAAQHPYRLLIQLGTQENGNGTFTMWLRDLITMQWTKLVTWDLGYPCRQIMPYNVYGFLENYHTYAAGYVRAVNFSDLRCLDAQTGQWKALKTVNYTVNNSSIVLDYNGSYNFGADDSSFWIATSGVSGLCPLPGSTSYSVQKASEDSPL